ncbi:MAG: DUF3119 family protein [Spirulina sp. SIO3F2]|nr:DUF3119 family protein [Spirulina sp. SIO3F2]
MTTTPITTTGTEIAPNYILATVVFLSGLPLLFLNLWLGGIISLFGIFLLIQTATIRLRFTETSLEVYRSDSQIRDFPYTDWQNWRVYFPALPILFYFKEVKSIHFIPMLFDPNTLQNCLKDLPRID